MYYIENFFGTVALITSIIGLLPQVYKSYKTKSTQDISMVMLINYLICSVSWIIYGLAEGSLYVIASNVLGGLVSMISIVQKYHYDSIAKNA